MIKLIVIFQAKINNNNFNKNFKSLFHLKNLQIKLNNKIKKITNNLKNNNNNKNLLNKNNKKKENYLQF